MVEESPSLEVLKKQFFVLWSHLCGSIWSKVGLSDFGDLFQP